MIGDYFSKWVEAVAIPNQTAHIVADVLTREVICRFGVPLQIHSDRGSNFESPVFKEVSRPVQPQLRPNSDGQVERFNRTLESMLACFTGEHQKDWDTFIPYLLMGYRAAEHQSTAPTS